MMTLSMPLSIATSVPFLNCIICQAWRLSAWPRGSMTMSLAPRLAACLKKVAATGMVLGRIGADHDDDVGVLALVEGRGHGGRADAFEQRRHRGGVAEPRAVIDIVGAEAGAHQLLEQIGLLVRALGRAEAGERARAVAVADFREALGGAVHRLLPGRLAEMRPRIGRIDQIVGRLADAVPADHRLGQALRIADVVEAEAALDAQPVLVGRAVLAGDVEQLVVLDVVGELAADAAIGADAVDRAVGHVRGGAHVVLVRPASTASARRSGRPARIRRRRRRSRRPSDRRSRTRSSRRGRGRPCRSRR